MRFDLQAISGPDVLLAGQSARMFFLDRGRTEWVANPVQSFAGSCGYPRIPRMNISTAVSTASLISLSVG